MNLMHTTQKTLHTRDRLYVLGGCKGNKDIEYYDYIAGKWIEPQNHTPIRVAHAIDEEYNYVTSANPMVTVNESDESVSELTQTYKFE
jgi:hypothetical protein